MAKKDEPKVNIMKTQAMINDKKYRQLVNDSISEMDNMANALEVTGMNKADAELMVKQLYFKNLKMAGEPAAMMQRTMAELATRIELDRKINPEADLVSDKYQKLLDLQMKALKTQASLDKKFNVQIQQADDKVMNFAFIDVEDS